MRTKLILLASAAALLALPALAQQAGQPQPAPATNTVSPSTPASTAPTSLPEGGADESAVEELSPLSLQPPTPPVEYPGWARRDPRTVGPLDPANAGLTQDAWGD